MPFFFLVELSVANRAIGSRKVRIFLPFNGYIRKYIIRKTFFYVKLRFLLFQLAAFILEVKVRTLHLRLLLLKTIIVFQCKFVKLLSKSRRQSQKETSLA